jgi:hypothetical protein
MDKKERCKQALAYLKMEEKKREIKKKRLNLQKKCRWRLFFKRKKK